MKKLFICVFVFATAIAQAQTGQKPVDGTKQTDKSAVEMTGVNNNAGAVTPNDRSAGANGSLTVENSKKPQAKKEKEKIPDGSYGTNRSGMPYSDDPNYPYDRDGKLIQNKGAEIITAQKQAAISGQTTGKSASTQQKSGNQQTTK